MTHKSWPDGMDKWKLRYNIGKFGMDAQETRVMEQYLKSKSFSLSFVIIGEYLYTKRKLKNVEWGKIVGYCHAIADFGTFDEWMDETAVDTASGGCNGN